MTTYHINKVYNLTKITFPCHSLGTLFSPRKLHAFTTELVIIGLKNVLKGRDSYKFKSKSIPLMDVAEDNGRSMNSSTVK